MFLFCVIGGSSRCGVYASDMKCRLANGRFYYYPDAMLADLDDHAEFYKERPLLIAEVQSKSTERIDRHEKWLVYQNPPSCAII